MFTGLVQQIGKLKKSEKIRGGSAITVVHDPWKSPLLNGDSIAVNGICFTVTSASPKAFSCDALEETIRTTNIAKIQPGAALNLERALHAGDSVGGHFVSGHVDGLASLVSVRSAGRDKVLRFECSTELLHGMVLKGSLACDGVSLTISDLRESFFEVNVVPFTWENTTLRLLARRDCINIETDMIGKYVRRYMETGKSSMTLSYDTLRDAGFAE